jgi:peroxiredoxin
MLGKPVPDFSLPSTGGNSFQLSSQRARNADFRDSRSASHQRFGVMKLKHPYGKQVRGIPKGWRGVQVTGHVQEVLNFVKSL